MHQRRTRPRFRRTSPRRPWRPAVDLLEARELLATLLVTTNADTVDPSDDALSLREAIEVAVGDLPLTSLSAAERAAVSGPLTSPAPNFLSFNLPTGQTTITVQTPLPPITAPLVIDGYTQPGAYGNDPNEPNADVANPVVRIDGFALSQGNLNVPHNGLDIQAPNCVVSGLIVTGFNGAALSVSGANSQGNFLWGNFLGIVPNPAQGREYVAHAVASGYDPMTLANGVGVLITSSNNRVGGNNPGLCNVIDNNGIGVSLSSPTGTGNLIQNNYILDSVDHGYLTTNADLSGYAGVGVLVRSSNNTIGEALAGGGNLISGNAAQGVLITGGPLVQGNNVWGNLIGSDMGYPKASTFGEFKGVRRRPNVLEGLLILDSAKNTIGGTSDAARNAIGGNSGDGIAVRGDGASGNRIMGNWVGFNIVSGQESLDLANQNGVTIAAPDNLMGDAVAGAGNTIGNNRGHGIFLIGPGASGTVVRGNVVGLNPGGGSPFGNALDGIHIDNASGTVIGGTTTAARNVISSNNNGVAIVGGSATGTLVLGNFIGTAADGLTDLGNAVDGVLVDNAPLTTIGGTATGAANVISGNNRGVHVTGAGALNSVIQGNAIGTDLAGAVVINNEHEGIYVDGGASSTLIGGTVAGAGNLIAFNAGAGVGIDSGTGNAIQGNAIYTNHALGIVLNAANSANANIPAPALTAAAPAGTTTGVQGTFTGAPVTTYTLEFFASAAKDPSGFGQGQTFLARFDVTTDVAGVAAFALVLPVAVPSGQFVTATATDATGNSSDFSNAVPAVAVQLVLANPTYTVNEADGTVLVSVTRTGGMGGDVAVDYATVDGTAVNGVDYTGVHGTLFFKQGDPPTRSFNIPILDPKKVGGSVAFTINLSNPTNGSTLGTPAASTVTILDNDLATLSLSTSAVSVNENSGSVILTVTRNSASGTAIVSFATVAGTAAAGTNYTATSGTLTFLPGDTSRSITVPVLDDLTIRGPLTFQVVLFGASGALLDPAGTTTTVTVLDTDTAGTVALATGSLIAAPGAASATLTVNRTAGAAGTITVAFATAAGTATPGVDYTGVSGTLTFAPGELTKVITVPLLNNAVPGTDGTFTVRLSNPTGGASLGAVVTATVTVRHPGSPVNPGGNDRVPPTITSFLPVPGAAGVAGLSITFSEPMNVARASDLTNYATAITTPGPDGVIGTWDDGSIPVSAVVYIAAQQQAVMIFQTPLPFGTFAQVVLNRDAGLVPGRGLADLSGNLLDGTGTGRAPGTRYQTIFAEGRRFAYTDRAGDSVTISLAGAGSGLMALQRNASGDPVTLRVIGATAPGTITGSVLGPMRGRRRAAPSPVIIPSITGAAGVAVRLSPPFRVGSITGFAVQRPATAVKKR